MAVRLRRDFATLLALIRAHALLHRASRAVSGGRIIATIQDYAAVRELVLDVVSDAVGLTVTKAVRETVEAVHELTKAGGEASVTRLATVLAIDKASASRRVRAAIDGGYPGNLEERRVRPFRLTIGDPLPEQVILLPEPEQVLRSCRWALARW